jgi:hypothetical protein
MTLQSRSSHVLIPASRRHRTKPPTRIKTTLYDVVAALQAVTAPEQDHLAVSVIVHWFRTGRLTAVQGIPLSAQNTLTGCHKGHVWAI